MRIKLGSGFVAGAVLSLLAMGMAGGCQLLYGLEPAVLGDGGVDAGAGGMGGGGMGGGTASSSGSSKASVSSSAMSSSSSGMVCMSGKDCGQSDFCTTYSCAGGMCMSQMQPKGTQLPSQIYGDCHVDICGITGEQVTGVLDSDVYDDGNPCTDKLCVGGVPTNLPKAKDTSCGGGSMVCDGTGHCVECTNDSQCDVDPKTKCNPGGVCVTDTCNNGLMDPGESDVDCGGSVCPPCADYKYCTIDSDCLGQRCTVKPGDIVLSCYSTCTDQAKNHGETDTDCGGPCKTCAMGQHCAKPSDCGSKVCKIGICQPPACNDGVQNGQEMGIDCGGGCMACPP